MKLNKHRIVKYCEGSERPLKKRMRSQLAVEITETAGRLAQSLEYKNIWIKRDKNLEEREKEKRQKAKVT